MIVAVTGASGFVGGRLVRRLRARGHTVHAYGRRAASAVARDLQDGYVSWDVASGPLDSAPDVDAVVHCAGTVTDWGPPELFESVNVRGTQAVVHTWPRARFVHVSTASVYDPRHGGERLTEDAADPTDRAAIDKVRWLNHYGRTKRLAEHAVASEAGNWIILRPHAIYGPGDTQLVPEIARRVRHGRLFIPGDGRARISVVHVDNLLDAIEQALASQASGAYNIVDDVAPSIDDALRTILAQVGRPARIVYIPRRAAWALGALLERVWLVLRRATSPPVTRYAVSHMAWENILDTTRARRDLDFRPRLAYPESFATISAAEVAP